MKKFFVLFLILLLLVSQPIQENITLAADNTDIIITYTPPEDAPVAWEPFTLEVKYKNNTGSDIENIFIIIDADCSFTGVGTDVIEPDDRTLNNTDTNPYELDLVYKGTGNELKLTFRYDKSSGGVTEEVTHSIFLDVDSSSKDSSSSQTRDTSRYVPTLSVKGGTKMPSVRAGKDVELKLPIENTSSHYAKDIILSLEAANEGKFPFLLNTINLLQSIDRISGNDVENVVYKIKVDPNAVEGVYPLKLNYEFKNSFGNAFTSSETIYINVQSSNTAPRPGVESLKLEPEYAVPGESITASIYIWNNGTLPAKDMKVSLTGLGSDGFALLNSTDVTYIPKMEGRRGQMLEYELSASNNIESGNHPLEVKIEYKDENNNSFTETNKIFIPVKRSGEGKPNIILKNISSPKSAVGAETDFITSFDVVNTGSGTAENVKLTLSSDSAIITKSLNTIMVNSLEEGESQQVSFTLSATAEAETKNYPIAINVEYDEVRGGSTVKHNLSQYIGVYVESGSGKNVPRIIVSQYVCEPSDVQAGENFELVMSFLNTSRSVPVGNIKVSLSSEDGTFTPANSSNTFFIENMSPQESVGKSIVLFPKADVQPKSYPLSLSFEYQDGRGEQYTAKEIISIPVQQTPRLVTSEIVPPPEAFVGQSVPVSLEFYNMGKSTLYNLMISAEGDFDGQNSNYFVGNFDPGRSDYFDAMVMPRAPGPLTGNIVFSFEDETGKKTEIKKEFTMNVMDMQQMMGPEGFDPRNMHPGMMDQGKKGGGILKWIIGVLILAGGITASVIILRKKRIAKKGMTLDE